MIFVDRNESARYPHPQRVGLTRETTTRSPHSDVKIPFGFNELEGLLDPYPEAGPGEIFLKGTTVDRQVTLSWPEEDARHRRLTAAHCLYLLGVGHVVRSRGVPVSAPGGGARNPRRP